MVANRALVVFSDVDGVFDDPSPTWLSAAARAVTSLTRNHVPLVLCSSKTRAELEHISQGLGIRHPFICEQGGAVFIPQGYLGFAVPNGREVAGYEAIEFGHPYTAVVDTLRDTAARLRIGVRGFSDMSVAEVAQECGLSLLRARLAKLREYGELFRVIDPSPIARTRLFKALSAAHLLCTAGRRHDHVGAAVDHRMGVDVLCGLYRRACGAMLSVGFADARSERNLFEVVDVPVFVKTPDTHNVPNIMSRSSVAAVANVAGVEDWAEAIVDVVEKHQRQPASPSVKG